MRDRRTRGDRPIHLPGPPGHMGRFETRRDRPSRAARRPVRRRGEIPRMNIQSTPSRIFRHRPLSLPRLNPSTMLSTSMVDDLDRKHREMETASSRREASSSLEGDSSRCGSEHGLRGRTSGHPDASRNPRPARATRFIETKPAMLSNAEIPLFLPDQANWSPRVEIWITRLTPEYWPAGAGRAACHRQPPEQDERE